MYSVVRVVLIGAYVGVALTFLLAGFIGLFASHHFWGLLERLNKRTNEFASRVMGEYWIGESPFLAARIGIWLVRVWSIFIIPTSIYMLYELYLGWLRYQAR